MEKMPEQLYSQPAFVPQKSKAESETLDQMNGLTIDTSKDNNVLK